MIVTLTIKADDLRLTQVLDKYFKEHPQYSYDLKRQDGDFLLATKMDRKDLGELVRRLGLMKDAKVKIQHIYETTLSKMINVPLTRSNVDALIGKETTTLTEIDPICGGIIKVVGEKWHARPNNSFQKIEKGVAVKVVRVDGVSLYVEEVKKENV